MLPLFLVVPTFSLASSKLDEQDFQKFLIVNIVYGFLVLFEGGVGRATVIFFQQKLDINQEKIALYNAILLSALILTIATAVLISIAIYFAHWLGFGRIWIDIIISILPQLYIGGIAAGLFLTLSGFLEAKLRFSAAMISRAIFTGSFYLTAIIGFSFEQQVDSIITLMSITRIFFISLCFGLFARLRLKHFKFKIEYFWNIKKISLPIFSSSAPGIIVAFFERLAPIALHDASGSTITTYLTTIDVYGKALVAPLSVNRSVFPDIAQRGLYLARQGLFFALISMSSLAVIVFLSSFWLTPKIYELWLSLYMSSTDRLMLVIMSASWGLTVINQVFMNALQASQRSNELLILQLSELIVFIVTFLVLASDFGLLGVAGASLVRAVFDLLGLSFLTLRQYLRMRKLVS